VSYVGLGSVVLTASLDTTGFNQGNYTCSFTEAVMSFTMPHVELYHAVVLNVPVGAQATVNINNKSWGFTYPLFGSEWNPPQPMSLTHGDQVDFLWNIVASGQAPIVTVWLRYDPELNPGYI
jgi:hypothetical protein